MTEIQVSSECRCDSGAKGKETSSDNREPFSAACIAFQFSMKLKVHPEKITSEPISQTAVLLIFFFARRKQIQPFYASRHFALSNFSHRTLYGLRDRPSGTHTRHREVLACAKSDDSPKGLLGLRL